MPLNQTPGSLRALLVRVTQRLIGAPPDRVRGAIESAMRAVGEHYGFSWVQLYLLGPDGQHGLALCEWTDGRIAAHRDPDDLDTLDTEDFPWFSERMRRLEPLQVEIAHLPAEAARDQERLAVQGIQSSVLVPMLRDGALAGVAAFHSAELLAPLPEGGLELLQLAADVFTEALSRRQAEVRLRESESRFRLLAEASQEGIVVHDDGIIVDVNVALTELLGYPREELVGQHVRGPWLAPDEQGAVAGYMARGYRGTYQTTALHRSGRRVPIEVVARQLDFEGHSLRVAALRDITARVRADTLLRESEERFRALVESVFDGVIIAKGPEILSASDGFARMFGRSSDEIAGLEPEDLTTTEDALRVRRHGREAREEPYEITGVRTDGSTFPVQLLGRAGTHGGEPVRVIGFRDLTEERRAAEEAARMEEHLRHAQKLESLGVLAGGIAHDFNNLLAAILGNADLALLEGGLSPRVERALQQIRTTGERAAELTQQMLDYSGRGRATLEPVELNDLVDEMADLLAVSLPKKVRLHFEYAPGLPTLDGDPAQLRQVVLNLITNAAEAVGEHRTGAVVLKTELVETRGERDVVGEAIPAGRYVRLEVSDDGVGMDTETAARIFEPFFTTKFTGRGLGLAAVLGIIRGHRGAIQLRTAPGRGTRVRVLLPPGAAVAPQRARPAAGPSRAEGVALVIDDERAVREVASAVLARMGLDVHVAEDGTSGVAAFEARRADVAVVLLDLTMPDLGGEEVFERIRALRGDVPVLFSSGYDAPDSLAELLANPGVAFVRKPFRVSTMTHAVAELIG